MFSFSPILPDSLFLQKNPKIHLSKELHIIQFNYESMTMAIRFQVLPEELENRVKSVLNGLVEGKLTDIQMASFFFKYFFQRLDPMYKDTPKIAQTIQDAVKNQDVGLIVPKLIEVTMHINTISDMVFTNGVGYKTPSLSFADLQVVEEVILARINLPEALIAKKIKIKKLGKILKWLAPIATIQTEEMLQKVRDEELALLSPILKEMGF